MAKLTLENNLRILPRLQIIIKNKRTKIEETL